MSEICLHMVNCPPSYNAFVRRDLYKRLEILIAFLMLRKNLLFFLLVATVQAQINPSQKEYGSLSYNQGSPSQGAQNWQNNNNQGQSPLLFNGYRNPHQNNAGNTTLSPLVSAANSQNQSTVLINMKLQGFKGHPYLMSNDRACACVPGVGPCDQLDPAPRCKFGFMIVIASPEDSVKYNVTHFFHMDGQGNLNVSNDGSSFTAQRTFELKSKPTAIDLFVHNFGAVLDATNNGLIRQNELFHVDTFAVPLNDKLPSVGGYASNPFDNNYSLRGMLFGNELQLSFSIACKGDLIGANCDLRCNVSSSNSAICRNRQGFYSVCTMQNGQATNCQNCPYGYAQQLGQYLCLDINGTAQPYDGSGLVAASFETWTIILAIVAALLLLALIFTIIWACVAARRRPVQPDPGYTNYRSGMRSHEGQAERPLLQTPNDGNGVPTGRPPVAPMRMNPPSLTAQPQKSALRKGNYAPTAHYGGDSVNETLNSSFASSVPIPPSRSADV
ncbi:hypothetical protein QR680_002333 [Steinernema hermaphroditum]|uniref:Uncharacterized protein n=1 Tax=Steinernema hermaphroditum TaxID=289476 RepID=A0AA39H4G3_9BILA|nr:hypothetical protein QR680_002333 [Steinernema hermaphroditum]